MKLLLVLSVMMLFYDIALAEISDSNKTILEEYPQRRYIGSGMSLLMGAFSIRTSVNIFNDDKSASDNIAALGLLVLV